uniref:Uncharacterized protein n=1 Tax=viral metagenome TaxID=1070528 RepID=A0A6C0EBR1_9ZZZZ
MQKPVFKDDEPVHLFIQKMQIYEYSLKKDRIELIKKFINEWTKGKFDALLRVNYVWENKLPSPRENSKLVKKYYDEITEEFKINYDFNAKSKKKTAETKSDSGSESEDEPMIPDKITTTQMIKFLSTMLKSIGYNIKKITHEKGNWYKIVNYKSY